MLPAPPKTLSKEFTRVWLGWCAIGDREVAREAAAKGIYISLALQFIATRKEWDHSDVERWFKSEILAWVYQLLEQRQIFKACHILTNISLDSTEQLGIILAETNNKNLRNYIAEHLYKNNKLDSSLLNTWRFLTILEKYNHVIKSSEDFTQISILKIDQKSREWKSEIATVLFFITFDFQLEHFLTPESAWIYLLSNENLEILKLWINICFTKDLNYDCKLFPNLDTSQKLKHLFLLWEITNAMIDELKTDKHSVFVRDFVLNELSKFGIFIETEIPLILSRFSKTQNIEYIYKILDEPNSNLNINYFYEKFNTFCIERNLYEVLSVCSKNFNSTLVGKNKELSLLLRKQELTDNFEENILNFITVGVNYFCENFLDYLQENPIVLIAIILFSTNFYDILINNNKLIINEIEINSDLVKTNLLIHKLPIFKNIFTKFTENFQKPKTLYQLLENHENLLELYTFRLTGNEILNFNNKQLNLTYGYTENINYLYYIKQNRPGKAAKLFILDQFRNYGRLDESKKFEALQKTTKLAIINCDNSEITASCVSFSEMIGNSTLDLRILINSYKVLNTAKIPNLNQMFNTKHYEAILSNLELVFNDYNSLEKDFVNFITDYELVIKFASRNHLQLPEQLLRHLAKHDRWLLFMIFSQIFNYPSDQILKLCASFENKEIAEHIYHALSNEWEFESLVTSIDRLTLSQLSCDFEFDDYLNYDLPANTNLLKTLIKCHKSGDPPTALLQACQLYQNPLLAILATCYEPDSVVTNWIAWLSISTDIPIDFVENYSISPYAVTELLEKVLEKNYMRTLLESIKIFLPENPLSLLLEFLHDCKLLNFNTCTKYLKEFEKTTSHLNYNTVLFTNDTEYTYLNNSYWLINTALKLIFVTLGSCFKSKTHQITFLNTLCTSEVTKNVPIECPNFCAVSQLLQCLSKCDIRLNLSVFFDSDSRKREIIRCIECLVQKKQYNYALELAKYENICKEYVLNEEWLERFQNYLEFDFWDDSNRAFENALVKPSFAAGFYIYCCTNLNDYPQKYRALKLAYKWLKLCNYSDIFVENIEHEIWSNYFALDDITLKQSYYDKHEMNYLLAEIKERTQTKSRSDHKLDNEQLRHLEETIGKILESGDIIEAVRLQKMFDYNSQELSILLTCYQLAEGKLSPYEISAEQRLLYLNRNMNLKAVPLRRRPMKSTRTSTLSISSYESVLTIVPMIDKDESINQDTLLLLETMTDRLKHGSNIASRILMCYRIALNTNTPYQDVVKLNESYQFLKTALDNNCKNKLEVVHDVIVIFKWSKTEITDFIFEELKSSIKKSISLKLDTIIMWDIDLNTQFHLILQLCSDYCSILGEKLLAATNTIQISHQNENNDENINLLIELLVRSHDCFNFYCNMEGIVSVLRKAQTITSLLLNLKNWKLMVRLLSGIGRYTEMNYIFQILKENDQFEYLLKKRNVRNDIPQNLEDKNQFEYLLKLNLKKDNGLKMAMLKFLKKHCPKNQELYRMVALHFILFSEVATLWENEALEMIDNLIEISKLEVQNQGTKKLEFVLFTNSDSTILCLNKIMDNFIHASEYHLHGEKLSSAMRTARQAELLALQISVLKSLPNQNSPAKCFLKLKTPQITTLITTELSFHQSKLLTESYNFQTDWGLVLFSQCVLQGKINYLDDFLTVKPLTNTLAQDLTRRFLAENITTQLSVKSMKEVLKKLSSVHMKYRLASELGFSDVIEPLLSGSQLAYLKDTVWKRGYKQL